MICIMYNGGRYGSAAGSAIASKWRSLIDSQKSTHITSKLLVAL